jgi:hypothetical protein
VIEPVEQADRPSQCASEVRDCGIDRDDQVQIGERRRGVGEVVQLRLRKVAFRF